MLQSSPKTPANRRHYRPLVVIEPSPELASRPPGLVANDQRPGPSLAPDFSGSASIYQEQLSPGRGAVYCSPAAAVGGGQRPARSAPVIDGAGQAKF